MGQCWKSGEQFNVPVGYELSYSETSPVQTGLVWSGDWICLNSRRFVTAHFEARDNELTGR